MRQRLVSQTDKQRETDRQGWAGSSTSKFQVNVEGCGEALSGPYYFGRAYESPPRFTWSGSSNKYGGIPPMMTVGVAEWITDTAGMYIGAYLWYKVQESGAAVSYAVVSAQDSTSTEEGWPLSSWTIDYDPDGLLDPAAQGLGSSPTLVLPGDYLVNVALDGRYYFELSEFSEPWDPYPYYEGWELTLEVAPSIWGQSYIESSFWTVHTGPGWESFGTTMNAVIKAGHTVFGRTDVPMGLAIYMTPVNWGPGWGEGTVETNATVVIYRLRDFQPLTTCVDTKSPSSSNILTIDAETQHALTGDVVPQWLSNVNVSPRQYRVAPAVEEPSFVGRVASISDVDPFSGDHHFVLGTSGLLAVGNMYTCPFSFGYHFRTWITNFADDGDQITVRFRVKRISGTDPIYVTIWRQSHTASNSVHSQSFDPGSSYEQVSTTYTFEALSYYMAYTVWIGVNGTATFYVDDIEVGQA